MTIFRPVGKDDAYPVLSVTTPSGNNYRHALEDRDYDDQVPADAEILRAFPGHFVAPNIEQATAAPGEKRATTRKSTKKK